MTTGEDDDTGREIRVRKSTRVRPSIGWTKELKEMGPETDKNLQQEWGEVRPWQLGTGSLGTAGPSGPFPGSSACFLPAREFRTDHDSLMGGKISSVGLGQKF